MEKCVRKKKITRDKKEVNKSLQYHRHRKIYECHGNDATDDNFAFFFNHILAFAHIHFLPRMKIQNTIERRGDEIVYTTK